MTSVPLPDEPTTEGSVIAQKYRLESLLGEGGMGAVWRAFNLQLEVPVAIKLLRAGMYSNDLAERLRVEARAAAKLAHPGIVRVFDIGEAESGAPFIVMELLHGESLGDMLQRGPLSPLTALQLLLPIAEALSLAHSRGVVHRDLKPDNIFIANEGSVVQPKLLDFGIAKVQSAMIPGGPTLTQTGTILGSPDYMSPEQAQGSSDIDERSDVWAFCVVLYEVLSGRAPFSGDSCQAILRSVLRDEPIDLARLVGLDPALSALIQRGLSKARDKRPASIFELGQELAGWLYAQGVHEDATGSALEARWLGRIGDASGSLPEGALSPRAQQEHRTLVSVVHPSPRASSDDFVIDLPLPRRRRWVPSALVATAALMGCLGWASVQRYKSFDLGSIVPTNIVAAQQLPGTNALPVAETATPAAIITASGRSRVDAVPIAALPVEPPPAPPSLTRSSKPPRAPVAPHVAATPPQPTRSASLQKLPNAESTALPQALPALRPRAELLNPY
jgi:serine/threonine protein kinase